MNSPGEAAIRATGRSADSRGRALALLLALALLGWAGWATFRWRRTASLWDEARASARRGRWPDAERALTKLAWYRPDAPELLRLRGRVALALGDPASAIRWLAKDVERSPEAADSRFLLGRLLLERFRAR